jgi:DNA-binding response OmpR family regulator
MSGFELLPAMRAMDGLDQLPAIFLSGRVEQDDVEAGRAIGATYLTKPFSANALTRTIQKLAPGRDRLVSAPPRGRGRSLHAARAAKYAPPPSARS